MSESRTPENHEPQQPTTPDAAPVERVGEAPQTARPAANAAPATAPGVESTAPTAQLPPVGEPFNPYAPPPKATKQPKVKNGESFTKRRPLAVPVIAALAVGALVGGVSGAGVSIWATSLNTGVPVSSGTTAGTITVNDTTNVNQVTAIAANASPSVVTLNVSSSNGSGTGSGVVLDDQGNILTNAHVITLDGAASDATITVTTNDGRLLQATVVGTDPTYDLAVINVKGAELPPIEFADSSKLNVGDAAVAIGAPLGLAGTVTNGIISALNRSITVASSAAPEQSGGDQQTPPEGTNPYDFFQFDVPGQQQQQQPQSASSSISLAVIQTDASINPGNSGGALLDSKGKLIGINVAIASAGGSSTSGASGSIGVGFAIPANTAKRIAQELVDTGSATHGLLGASVIDVQNSQTVKDATVVGAAIEQLSQGGAAEAAGLKTGDIVTQVDGVPITGATDLTAQIRALAAGATAEITYVRDGKANTAQVTLGTLEQ